MNEYLKKDLEIRLQTSNLFEWIDKEGESLARMGLSKSSMVEFTRDVLDNRRISKILSVKRDTSSADAFIQTNGIEFIIYYNKEVPFFRRRFAIAHEIGHTYWFSPGNGQRPLSPIQLYTGRDPDIEDLCDRFASAFLLPRQNLLEILRKNITNYYDCNIPYLHLAPKLSKHFGVAEQAVVRRLFFELFPCNMAFLCVRSSPRIPLIDKEQDASQWKLAWCALPRQLELHQTVSGIKIPFKTNGRNIPEDMIPAECRNTTEECLLDGRFWLGIKGQIKKTWASYPLRKWPECERKRGYAYNFKDSVFIALPL
jgi:Zn-dependent peptidase ImmA (M78 family)